MCSSTSRRRCCPGLRLGKAAGLRLQDVDFLRRVIHVRHQVQGATVATPRVVLPKYGSERTVHAPAELPEMLAAHVRTTGVVAGDWIFSLAGVPLTRNAAGHQWHKVRLAAGLEQSTLHDLRHFHASGLIAAGCDVVTVQRALGHSSATIRLTVHRHPWPTAEDRTRAAATELVAAAARAPADQVRTEPG
jgi:integrase